VLGLITGCTDKGKKGIGATLRDAIDETIGVKLQAASLGKAEGRETSAAARLIGIFQKRKQPKRARFFLFQQQRRVRQSRLLPFGGRGAVGSLLDFFG
jgi:hypothetical protein